MASWLKHVVVALLLAGTPIAQAQLPTPAFSTVDTTAGYKQHGVTILTQTNNTGHAFGTDPTDLLIGIGAGAALDPADYLTTAVGWHAMNVLQEANTESSAFGWHSQGSLVHGVGNDSHGINTIGSCITGCSYNMAFGGDSMRNSFAGTFQIGFGVSTLREDNAGHNIAIGYHTYISNQASTGTFNIAIGQAAFDGSALTTGSNNLAIGAGNGGHATSASNNVMVGHQAGLNITTDLNNTLVGALSGMLLAGSGGANTFLGFATGRFATTGAANTLLGYEAGFNLTTDSSNVLIGNNAGWTLNGSGGGNVVVGSAAGLAATTATANTLVGNQAGHALTTDASNTLVGGYAGFSLAGSGGSNVFLGATTGYGVTTGGANTLLGGAEATSRNCVTTGSRNVAIGYGACIPAATSNYQLVIANGVYGTGLDAVDSTVSHVRIGIGTKAPNATLTIGSAGGGANDGHLGFLGTAPAISGCTGCTLSATASDGAGTLTEGTTQTGFVLTFAIAYATAPTCVVSSPTGHSFTSYTATTTTLTVANGSQTASKYSYVCVQ